MVGYQDKSKINRDMGAQTGFILLRIVTNGKTSLNSIINIWFT
jgi:hypothetical protein